MYFIYFILFNMLSNIIRFYAYEYFTSLSKYFNLNSMTF